MSQRVVVSQQQRGLRYCTAVCFSILSSSVLLDTAAVLLFFDSYLLVLLGVLLEPVLVVCEYCYFVSKKMHLS